MGRRMILLTVWVCLCVTRCCRSRLCDNGKANLTIDLPDPEELLCQELWPQSQMNIPDIDMKYYSLRAADSLCMDTPIKYNEHIPTHGPYRHVEAESGEYLYCPPQRWLNNLKNGALVFLYHPCVSAEAHMILAVLAHSCLPHYILTPHPRLSQHRPFAVVSSGRSLEMSRITLRVCDWLLSISLNISQASTIQRAKYNLYLTKPAPVDKPVNTSQEISVVERLKSLKSCCMEALIRSEVQRSRGRTRTILKRSPEEVKLKETIKSDEINNTESTKQNGTDTLPQNNTKEMDSSSSMLTITQSHSSAKNSVLFLGPSSGYSKTTEKQFPQTIVTEKHNYQAGRKTLKKTIMKDKKHRIKTDTKAQTSASECREFGQSEVLNSKSAHIKGPTRGERIPIPRTDEAVWAAGALGFLLVLLTLSVLHTRLYRHCRPSTSLYWHDNHQEYENVGDIIRRRLRKFGRRKRRSNPSRRQECPLLSNSSNDENSD